MGNAAGINNAGGNVCPSIKNDSVTLCYVEQKLEYYKDFIHLLSVLAVLKQHDFEIKPLVVRRMYFCELRQGVRPWPSETLDQAMRNAIPDHQRNKILPGLEWNFA